MYTPRLKKSSMPTQLRHFLDLWPLDLHRISMRQINLQQWASILQILRPAGVSDRQPAGRMQPRTAVNAAQHNIVNLRETLWDFFVVTHPNVFDLWPKTTLLLPVWPGHASRLVTPGRAQFGAGIWRQGRKPPRAGSHGTPVTAADS